MPKSSSRIYYGFDQKGFYAVKGERQYRLTFNPEKVVTHRSKQVATIAANFDLAIVEGDKVKEWDGCYNLGVVGRMTLDELRRLFEKSLPGRSGLDEWFDRGED